MSPDSTRGWDSRIRAWVGHPAGEAPAHSVCYQLLPPNGSRAGLAFRYRLRAGGEAGIEGRPLVSRVLVGSASLLTPEVAIALCWTGLPLHAGARPGQVAAGAELVSLSADDLGALSARVARELDDAAAWMDGLAQVVAIALADPGAPLAVVAAEGRILDPATQIAPLLWGLCRITRPLLGTVRRGWSFSTFELPPDSADPQGQPDIVFRPAAGQAAGQPEAAAERASPPAARREAGVHLGPPGSAARPDVTGAPAAGDERDVSEHGALAGTAQAWLADWLVAEYRAGGGDAVARLIADCAVEQPLHARLAAVYDLLYVKWADKALDPPCSPQAARSPEAPPGAQTSPSPQASQTRSAPPSGEPVPGLDLPASPDGSAQTWPEGGWAADADGDSPFPEPDDDEPPAYRTAGRSLPEPGSLGPFPRAGTPPPLPPRQQGPHQRAREQRAGGNGAQGHSAWGQGAWGDGSWDHGRPEPEAPLPQARPQPASMPELLIRLAGTRDGDDFSSALQEVLTLSAVPEFGDRVEARRLLAEASWCIHPSRADGRELHADELSRIFQLIVNPDLGRPRAAREIADWATIAPSPVIRGLLAGAKAGDRSAEDACYSAMMRILEPVLAGRWIDEHGLQADWQPRRPGRRHEPGFRALRPFRKRP